MIDEKFKVIAVCGSVERRDYALALAEKLSREGNITLLVGFFGSVEDTPNKITTDKESELILRDLAMIDMCDILYVANPDGDVDVSTARKISYAQKSCKQIQYAVSLEDELPPVYVEALVICSSELFKNVFAPTEEDVQKIGMISALSFIESDENSDAVKEFLLRIMNEPSADRIEYEETNTVIIKEFTIINMLIDANRNAFDPMLDRMNQDILVRLRPAI